MLGKNTGTSPYEGLSVARWEEKTLELVAAHPLSREELVQVVLKAWGDILNSSLGTKPFKIGVDIYPSPQIMAFLLHELIPLELADRYPAVWRGNQTANEKDLVYIPNDSYSVEIKASSSTRQIFGNRSYAQKVSISKKSKSGYYLGVNFEKFSLQNRVSKITRIRFGWLDHVDWLGQKAATGQQARLNREADQRKLLVLYS